jgi:hypothetical protein
MAFLIFLIGTWLILSSLLKERARRKRIPKWAHGIRFQYFNTNHDAFAFACSYLKPDVFSTLSEFPAIVINLAAEVPTFKSAIHKENGVALFAVKVAHHDCPFVALVVQRALSVRHISEGSFVCWTPNSPTPARWDDTSSRMSGGKITEILQPQIKDGLWFIDRKIQ